MAGDDTRCRGCWSLGNNCGLCWHCRSTRPAPPPLVSIHVCVNDRHGNHDGEMRAVSFEMGGAGALVELEPGDVLGVRFCGDRERVEFKGEYKAAPYMLKVYGHGRLPVWVHARCVGNMHWDVVGFAHARLPFFLRWLALRGWRCTSGPTRFFDYFNSLDAAALTSDDYCAELAKALR